MSILLERRVDLAPEVGARREGELEIVGQALLVGIVQPLEHVRKPPDAALAQDEPEPRMALADAGEDHRREDFVHLHRAHHDPRADGRRAPRPLHLVAHGRRAAFEDVEGKHDVARLGGDPHRLPHGMPHGHRCRPRQKHHTG